MKELFKLLKIMKREDIKIVDLENTEGSPLEGFLN